MNNKNNSIEAVEAFEHTDNTNNNVLQSQVDDYMTELFVTLIRAKMEVDLPLAANDNDSSSKVVKNVAKSNL